MIIGLTGYAQSGKDTVAKILVEDFGYTRVAFADKIREFYYEIAPDYVKFIVDEVGWEKAKQFSVVRESLQDIGLGARKIFGDQFWIAQALRDVHFEGNFVITDMRFPNEAEVVRKYDNAQIWRVKRDGVEAVNRHPSETAMEGERMDQIVKNNGTIEDLKILIHSRMNGIASE